MNRPPTTAVPVGLTAHRRGARVGRAAAGLALVEIMIALALGLMVIAALGQLYSGSRQSYRLSDALARLDENGRFAVDFLANDIRMAGYLSCGGESARIGNSVNPPVNSGDNWIYDTRGLAGYDGGAGSPPTSFNDRVPGTDILIVRRASLEVERRVIWNDSTAGTIKLQVDHGFKVGEILVVSNPSCTQASLFQVTGTLNLDHPEQAESFDAVKYGPAAGLDLGNCTGALFGTFDCSQQAVAETGVFRPGSVLSRYAVHAYYVTAGTLAKPPILVRKRLTQANGQATLITEELIRDVENFQVLYGRDTSADTNHRVDDYVSANLVTDWAQVVSIRFALLMRSREANVRSETAGPSYDLLGATVTPTADRRIRRSFGGVVALRNYLP